jgi:hypothetical protein
MTVTETIHPNPKPKRGPEAKTPPEALETWWNMVQEISEHIAIIHEETIHAGTTHG